MKQKVYAVKINPEIIIPDYATDGYKPEELQEIDITSYKAERAREAEKLSETRSRLLELVDSIDVSTSTLEDIRLCLSKEISDKEAFEIALKVLKRVSAEAYEIYQDMSL